MTQKIDTQIVAADVNADQAPAKRNAQFVCYSLAAVAAMTVQGLQKALENLAGKSGDLQRSLAKVFFELSRREGSPKKVTAWARDAIGLDLQTECQAVYECAALLRAMDSGKVPFAEEDFDNLPISGIRALSPFLRDGVPADVLATACEKIHTPKDLIAYKKEALPSKPKAKKEDAKKEDGKLTAGDLARGQFWAMLCDLAQSGVKSGALTVEQVEAAAGGCSAFGEFLAGIWATAAANSGAPAPVQSADKSGGVVVEVEVEAVEPAALPAAAAA